MPRSGILFIISSPSGAGKSTICRKLLQGTQDLYMSISTTTRAKRATEVDQIDYHFTSIENFQHMVKSNDFLEYAQVFNNYYGTPKKYVADITKQGKDVLFDIDWKGARQLVAHDECDVVTIFILPPSISELEQRLKNRAQDSLEVVRQRMQAAYEEISHWKEYDYVLINDDVNIVTEQITSIINTERLKRIRQVELENFVKNLK